MAEENDSILMSKTAGIEGTAIIAGLTQIRKILPNPILKRGKHLLRKISVVNDARLAFSSGLVHSMHDVTEGGVLGAVAEMSIASGVGFILEGEKILVDKATSEISSKLKINPLKLIGSGSLLISTHPRSVRTVQKVLSKSGIRCSEIGRFVGKKHGRTLKTTASEVKLRDLSFEDELWGVLRKYG
jgi:hydrogenase expression/formation protein HypE